MSLVAVVIKQIVESDSSTKARASSSVLLALVALTWLNNVSSYIGLDGKR